MKFVSEPVTVMVLPLFTVRLPLSVKLPAVVKFAPDASAKLPLEAIVVNPARPLLLLVEFTISPVPCSVMLAASVTMLAPANDSFPPTV